MVVPDTYLQFPQHICETIFKDWVVDNDIRGHIPRKHWASFRSLQNNLYKRIFDDLCKFAVHHIGEEREEIERHACRREFLGEEKSQFETSFMSLSNIVSNRFP